MIIGVPKEIKNNENRVGLVPAGVEAFVNSNHVVYIQKGAGEHSGISDQEYESLGAKMISTIEEVYEKSEMIIKVKEPVEKEYPLIKNNQILFTYFHFASNKVLTEVMIKNNSVCIAYETVEKKDRSLPLLIPMSEVAGRMSIQEGAKFLEKPMGGRGILLGGIPGVKPAQIVVLGGGIVGTNAAIVGAGMGGQVIIMDISLNRLRQLAEIMPKNVQTVYSSSYNIREAIKTADLVIGAVLIPGAKAPHLITRDMLKIMKKGAVIVDVAVDQGGCIETCRPTTHDNPTYEIDGIVHYCVANMPGAVPYTSTIGLTNATLPYGLEIANKGYKQACLQNEELRKGLNIANGKVVYKGVADAFGFTYTPVEEVLR